MYIVIENKYGGAVGMTWARPGLPVTSKYDRSVKGKIESVGSGTLKVENFSSEVSITPLPIGQVIFVDETDAREFGWPKLEQDINYTQDIQVVFPPPYVRKRRRMGTM